MQTLSNRCGKNSKFPPGQNSSGGGHEDLSEANDKIRPSASYAEKILSENFHLHAT
jgi:hypothetical protein